MFRAERWDMRLTDKSVLRELHKRAAAVSQQEIAETVQCHENTVQRAIKRMISREYLSLISGGGRVPAQYLIHYDKLPQDVQDELL